MKQYLELCQHVLDTGTVKQDRTGTGTTSVFGHQMRFDLNKGFPLLTTKKLHFKSIVTELLWILNGDTNIKFLNDNGVRIWNEWADENGDLNRVYGAQWRNWRGADGVFIDQVSVAIDQLKNNPDSRRIIVNSWNVAELDNMALPPCHMTYQFYTRELTYDERMRILMEGFTNISIVNPEIGEELLTAHNIPVRQLSCQLYQR